MLGITKKAAVDYITGKLLFECGHRVSVCSICRGRFCSLENRCRKVPSNYGSKVVIACLACIRSKFEKERFPGEVIQ